MFRRGSDIEANMSYFVERLTKLSERT